VHVADRTVDGLAALRTADVFIGAGGTMCREAALLGVPAYTVFAGRMASVDRELIKAGMLHDLRTAEVDVEKWTRRDLKTIRRDEAHLRIRARELRSWLSALIEEVAG
jgi:predicted glycosyltransferase